VEAYKTACPDMTLYTATSVQRGKEVIYSLLNDCDWELENQDKHVEDAQLTKQDYQDFRLTSDPHIGIRVIVRAKAKRDRRNC
jgi:hypothetical protein